MPRSSRRYPTSTLLHRIGGSVVCLAVASASLAQNVNLPPKQAPVEQISRTQLAARVQHLEQVVDACRQTANACSASVGADSRVPEEGAHPEFLVHWDWLRYTLQTATKQKDNERLDAMVQASAHLKELEAELYPNAAPASSIGYERTQSKAEEVLQRAEFRPAAAAQPTWLQRKLAQFWMWFGGLFAGAERLGAALPWLGKTLEWGFFLLAAAGLVLFIRRNFARQQLQIALSSGAVQFSAWEREANDWASEADARAAKQEWRDAVHCLYWAAIVRLEAKRAWRHNPSRTPREYVRLLQGGSPQQSALRRLTGIFERVWYGLRPAEPQDYERAKSLFTELSLGTAGTVPAAGER